MKTQWFTIQNHDQTCVVSSENPPFSSMIYPDHDDVFLNSLNDVIS